MTTHSDLPATRGRWRGMRAMVAIVTLAAALMVPVATATPARADATFDQKMLELINQHRAAAGLGPVQGSLVLATIAGPGPYLGCGAPIGGRANDMGARNYFSHTILGCNQSVFNILASTVGLVYSAAAENIAWMNGTTDPLIAAQRLMNDLMASPGHRANILDARFTHVGIGSWRTAPGQTWSGGGTALLNAWITAQVFAQMPLTAAPAVSVSPTTIGFGDRVVGTTAPAQTVTVKNTGSAALSISGTSVTGANAADFSITSNTCAGSLAAGASCAVAVGFKPSATGPRSATLSVSNNAPGSPHNVTLSGSGSAAPLTGVPVGIVATGGDGQMTVSWAPAASGAPAVGYGVFIYDSAGYTGKSAWACATCTSTVVTGLLNGKQQYAAVLGHNGSAWGPSGLSNWAWVLATPGMPVAQRATPGDGSLTTTWQAPATLFSGIDGYGAFVYDANGYTGKAVWVCGTCTSATISGLVNGASYFVVLYAHNPNGWGPMSASPSVVVGTPGLPGNVFATKGNGAVGVTWSPSSTGGAPIVGYGAFVYDAAGYTGQYTWVCGTCTAGAITGLAPGKTYFVLVYAYNNFGWGVPAYSNAVAL